MLDIRRRAAKLRFVSTRASVLAAMLAEMARKGNEAIAGEIARDLVGTINEERVPLARSKVARDAMSILLQHHDKPAVDACLRGMIGAMDIPYYKINGMISRARAVAEAGRGHEALDMLNEARAELDARHDEIDVTSVDALRKDMATIGGLLAAALRRRDLIDEALAMARSIGLAPYRDRALRDVINACLPVLGETWDEELASCLDAAASGIQDGTCKAETFHALALVHSSTGNASRVPLMIGELLDIADREDGEFSRAVYLVEATKLLSLLDDDPVINAWASRIECINQECQGAFSAVLAWQQLAETCVATGNGQRARSAFASMVGCLGRINDDRSFRTSLARVLAVVGRHPGLMDDDASRSLVRLLAGIKDPVLKVGCLVDLAAVLPGDHPAIETIAAAVREHRSPVHHDNVAIVAHLPVVATFLVQHAFKTAGKNVDDRALEAIVDLVLARADRASIAVEVAGHWMALEDADQARHWLARAMVDVDEVSNEFQKMKVLMDAVPVASSTS